MQGVSLPSKQLGRSVLLGGVLIGVLSAVLYMTGILEPLEKRVYDSRLRSTIDGALHPSIAVLAIGESELSEIGNPPDPAKLAELVEQARNLGATDIAFNEPIVGSAESIAALASAAGEFSAVFAISYPPQEERRLIAGESPTSTPEPSRDLVLSATAIGFRNRLPGPDGTLRRFTPTIGERVEIGVAVAAAAENRNVRLPRQAPMIGEQQRLGPGPRLLIRYDRRPPSEGYLTVKDVMEGDADIDGKLLLVGVNADRVSRSWDTPLGRMADVEVTAQIASALMSERGITRAPVWLVVTALMAVSMALTVGATQNRPVADLLFPPLVGALMWVLSGFAFSGGTWIDIIPIFLVLGLHMIVMPSIRRSIQRVADGVPGGSIKRVFEGLLEVLLLGGFAHSGRIWLDSRRGPVTVAHSGEVPDHLLTAISGSHPLEANRDEGQVVFLPIENPDGSAGTAILLRRRGHLLSERRLDLLGRVAAAFGVRMSEISRRQAQQLMIEALKEISAILDEVDHFNRDHPSHIAALAVRIGKAAGLSDKQLEHLEIASYLHDLGKIGAPDTVIDSTVRLTDEEYGRVKQHPTLSRRILDAVGLDGEIGRIVGAHHERWDGKGYPEGRVAEDIPFSARILSISDTLTAMTSDRPYRKGMTLEVAIEELVRQKSRMFDPKLVDLTMELAHSEPDVFRSLTLPDSDREAKSKDSKERDRS